MTTLREILDKARAAKQRLPPNEAAVVFAAVVRLASAQKASVRARLVQIDDAGGLRLAPLDERIAETDGGYEAPELLAANGPRKNDPRVQVYAAGALGYELLTGRTPPQPGSVPGAELAGPVGDVVRMAMAPDRRERFGDLAQLQQALEGVQPRPPAEGERNIFAALRTRFSRPPPEKEAVAKVIDRLHQLEAQTVALGKTQSRLEAALRQVQESVERFEDGQRRASEAQRRRGSSVAPGLASGAVAALAVFGVAWALGMVGAPGSLRPPPSPAAASSPPAALPAPPPEPPIPAKETAKESPKEGLRELAKEVTRPAAKEPSKEPPPVADASAAAAESDDAGAVAEAVDAGGEPADGSVAAVEDAGAPANAATSPAPAPAPAPAPEKKRRPAQSNQAAMQHALAISEVRHGESALEQGQLDEALESFRAALENEPAMAVAFRGLGMAYSMQGKTSEALQAYQKYLKLAPNAPDAGDIRNSIKQLRAKSR
jgi:tetratricopeptide (TPR) repeat protein